MNIILFGLLGVILSIIFHGDGPHLTEVFLAIIAGALVDIYRILKKMLDEKEAVRKGQIPSNLKIKNTDTSTFLNIKRGVQKSKNRLSGQPLFH